MQPKQTISAIQPSMCIPYKTATKVNRSGTYTKIAFLMLTEIPGVTEIVCYTDIFARRINYRLIYNYSKVNFCSKWRCSIVCSFEINNMRAYITVCPCDL